MTIDDKFVELVKSNVGCVVILAGSGAVTLGAAGTTTALKSLSVTTSGLTILNGSLTTATATGIDFSAASGGVRLGNDITITTTTGNGVVNFGSRAVNATAAIPSLWRSQRVPVR